MHKSPIRTLIWSALVSICFATVGIAQQNPQLSSDEEIAAIEFPLFQFALERNDIRTWELFITRYPDSTLRPQAEAELAALSEVTTARTLEEELFTLVGPVTYTAPISIGVPEILGLSIEQVIKTTPAFPPIEGLPEEVWKDQSCASCHVWTRANICEHGQRYVNAPAESYQDKQHPFDGTFKTNLRQWALNDCE